MSFKPPELGRGTTLTDLLAASFQNELLAERASELGRTGERVAKAMSALSALEPGVDDVRRQGLLDDAAEAVWAYFIQREIAGYRNHRDAIAFYAIPQAVLSRVGIIRPRTG